MGKRDHLNHFLKLLDAADAQVYAAFIAAADRITSDAVLTRLADALMTGNVDDVMALLNLRREAFAPLEEAVRGVFMSGAANAGAGLRPGSVAARVLVQYSVRNPTAEAWLEAFGGERVTGYLQDMREVIQSSLLYGMERGQNPLTTARDLVGHLKSSDNYRKGGTLMLTRTNATTVANARAALASGDVTGMRHYLTLKTRDKRYDSLIQKAIAAGKPLTNDKREQIIGALADRYLKERAITIARTESLAALNSGKRNAFEVAMQREGMDDNHVHREWSSTGDRLVRPDHQHLDGQKVVGMHTPYRLPDGSPIMHPGDMKAGVKQVARCRCLEYIEFDYFLGRA